MGVFLIQLPEVAKKCPKTSFAAECIFNTAIHYLPHYTAN